MVNLIVKKLLQESINVVVKSWGVKCSKYWSSVPATATVVEPESED